MQSSSSSIVAHGKDVPDPSNSDRLDDVFSATQMHLDGTRGRKICFRTESHYECFDRSKSPMWTYDSAFNTYIYDRSFRSNGGYAARRYKIIDTAACELKLEPFSGASVASTARVT